MEPPKLDVRGNSLVFSRTNWLTAGSPQNEFVPKDGRLRFQPLQGGLFLKLGGESYCNILILAAGTGGAGEHPEKVD